MDYYCTGNLPWEVPFKAEKTVPKEVDWWDLGSFTLFSEPGTRFLCQPSKKVGDVFKKEINKLVLKDAVLLHIPKEPKEGGNLITVEELKAATEKCPARPGDAIILHTGHGDNEKYFKLGEKWEPWSPCLAPQTIAPLMEYLKKVNCSLYGYDTSNQSWQCTDLCSLHREWAMRKPRPAPNSPEAKEVAKQYILSGKLAEEFKALVPFTNSFDMIGCVVNCGAIKAERFKLIVAPLKVVDWGFVPATIYAIVE
jgi:kynurenine formamidase